MRHPDRPTEDRSPWTYRVADLGVWVEFHHTEVAGLYRWTVGPVHLWGPSGGTVERVEDAQYHAETYGVLRHASGPGRAVAAVLRARGPLPPGKPREARTGRPVASRHGP